MKNRNKSIFLIMTLCGIYSMQDAGITNQFMSPELIPITGSHEWLGWKGNYNQKQQVAHLHDKNGKKAIIFTNIHIRKTDIKNPSKPFKEFATMADPDGNKNNLFSDHLTLFPQQHPFILLGEEETK